ncbi:thiamine-phosphate kinase [Chitinimonas lacunae]|uniref:Thiamine-monophosphate kinase n=1 Tax=Chitinimonas lacunae TaxID=1963018 RepID=A0ABV8MMI7_9NEIS
MALGEFDLIRRYFSRATPSALLGIGDDAALVAPTPGQALVVAADTLVEGHHFFAGTAPEALGWKALAVNLSDMAAMGATPRWFTLCLTLPAAEPDWLAGFAAGLYALAERHQVELIGGDTTGGPLAFSVQILGEVAPGQALRRAGARIGDDVWLSGPTGAAALAVEARYGRLTLAPDDLAYCANRLDRPEPRVELGLALAGLAHAAIDISDGLLADAGHLAACSGVAVHLHTDLLPSLPLPPALANSAAAWRAALGGGDDYELCFTAAPQQRATIERIGEKLGLPLTRIGQIEAGQGVRLLDDAGRPQQVERLGFDHFAGK